MRIGLLTYHHSANYGAVMQSYATCRALKELGHEVEFINFRQDEKRSNSSIIFYFRFSTVWHNHLRNNSNELATVRFSAFCGAMLSNNSFLMQR